MAEHEKASDDEVTEQPPSNVADGQTAARSKLVSIIREMVNAEIADEADALLSQAQSSDWTPLSLIAAAERRYLEKNFGSLDVFSEQQMNSRIIVDVESEW